MIAPPLRHCHPLGPMRTPVIGGPHLVRLPVSKCTLDGVGRPLAGLVQERARRRAETMGGHLVRAVAEAAQGGIERVFRHRALRRPDGREEVASSARQGLRLLQDRHCLA